MKLLDVAEADWLCISLSDTCPSPPNGSAPSGADGRRAGNAGMGAGPTGSGPRHIGGASTRRGRGSRPSARIGPIPG
jgi:hypothetical protein